MTSNYHTMYEIVDNQDLISKVKYVNA